MSKIDFKSIYENIQLEKEYGITNEEDEKKESSDKESSDKKDSKENKTKVTPEAIIKDMMKFEPAQLLKFVAQQEDSGAKTWLLKNLIPFVIYAVKNNYIKAKALGSAIKNIGDKNKDDETGIDYDNVEIEESSIKTVYAFDDETIEKLQKFIDDYKKEMEAAKDDIETSSEELSKDIKKSGIKIEGEKLANNALTVAGVIDNKENKGKSGKELTKIVDQKIEAKKEIKEIEKKAEEIKKLTDKIKVDPKYEKMSPEELDKLASKGEKKNNKEEDDSKSDVKESISEADEMVNEAADGVLSIDPADITANIKVTGIFSKAGVDGYKKLMIKAYELKQQGIEGKEAIKQLDKYLEDQSWFNDAGSRSRRAMMGYIKTRYNAGDGILGPKFEKLIDKAVDAKDAVKNAASDAANKAIDNADDTMNKIEAVAKSGKLPLDSNKRLFDYFAMNREFDKFEDMFDDGKVTPAELEKFSSFSSRLTDYQIWASEHANSDDPVIQQRVALISKMGKKFAKFELDNADHIHQIVNDDELAAASERVAAGKDAKYVAKLADNEETKEVAKGWLGKAGKVLRVFGQAKIVAKFGKFVLNQGKEGVDAIGGQYVKFKEDQNVVAEMKFILMNAKDSSTKHSDTKFSVRFDTSDLKWHLTNLDDRKAKIEKEDVLMKKILDTKECKEFKKECLDNWTKLLQPKDEANKFIPYFIKNYDKLGVKITDKNQKKYFDTLKKLVDNFDEVKKQFA